MNKELVVYTGFSYLNLPSIADWTQPPYPGGPAPAFNGAVNQSVNFNNTFLITPTGCVRSPQALLK